MTRKIKERTTLYESLVRGAQALTQRVKSDEANYDDLVEEHNGLLEKYILGYNSLSSQEREDASRILGQTKSYIHGNLDVCRIRDMRTSLDKFARENSK